MIFGMAGCGKTTEKEDNYRLKIVTSLFPYYLSLVFRLIHFVVFCAEKYAPSICFFCRFPFSLLCFTYNKSRACGRRGQAILSHHSAIRLDASFHSETAGTATLWQETSLLYFRPRKMSRHTGPIF